MMLSRSYNESEEHLHYDLLHPWTEQSMLSHRRLASVSPAPTRVQCRRPLHPARLPRVPTAVGRRLGIHSAGTHTEPTRHIALATLAMSYLDKGFCLSLEVVLGTSRV